MLARLWGYASRTALSAVLTAVGLVVATLFAFVGMVVTGNGGSLVTLVVVIVTLAELGFAATAGVFLLASDGGREYVRVGLLDGRDWRYVAGGTAVAYAVALVATGASSLLDGGNDAFWAGNLGSAGEYGSVSEFEAARGLAPGSVEAALLALVVLSILVIGPSEELLFRGVIQRYLSEAFSVTGAIVVSSILFAAIHAPTFLLAGPGATGLLAGAAIFVISVTLGYSYAVTDNLLVPALVHGVYDATLFGVMYVALQLGIL